MENTTDMSSSKEEEDKAWWSDYQASTKLKRKWVKEEKSAFDDDMSVVFSILFSILNTSCFSDLMFYPRLMYNIVLQNSIQ